jgi:hypothetical protein
MTDPHPAAPPEELNGFLLVHATLRKGGADLLAATARFGETPRDPAVLVRLWGFYSRGLRQHHQGEDRIIFPLVASRVPDFADVEADMRGEHHTVDELLAAADAAVANLQSDPRAARAGEAHAVLGQLTEALDAHLAHEEADALPIVAAAIPDKEMAKIERGFLHEIPASRPRPVAGGTRGDDEGAPRAAPATGAQARLAAPVVGVAAPLRQAGRRGQRVAVTPLRRRRPGRA